MPISRMSAPYFARSEAMRAAKASGVVAKGSRPPPASRRVRRSGSRRAAATSSRRRAMIGAGTAAGAKRPSQIVTS
jgi:hypothetical protein